MFKFHKITLNDKEWIMQKLKEEDRKACEASFSNNFIWRNVNKIEVAELCECCVFKFDTEGEVCFSFPIGKGNKKQVLEDLIKEAKDKQQVLRFENILERDKEIIDKYFPEVFDVKEERDAFDYIYSSEKLASLAGKKLHGKRNHINRFQEERNWTYEEMTTGNKEECKKMNEIWCDRKSCVWNKGMENEFCAVQEAIDNFSELGLVGGVLRVDGKVVAFTIGEPLSTDTFVVHIEKAFPDMQGAYPMINQQFVQHECRNFKYVNREDDTGAEGLRKAKLSYYPDILLEKYSARFDGRRA